TDQQELQPPRLGRSNAVAMNGVDDDGYASQPSGPSAEDAGLGTVRVHDRRPETFQESRQLDERAQVPPGPNQPNEARHLVELDAFKFPGLVIQQPRLSCDQDGAEAHPIQMRDGEPRGELGTAELQFGDDMANRVLHVARSFSARRLPCAMASSIELCSQRP